MIDVVDWLRKEAELIALPRLAEAAVEIERLRERNNVLEIAHQQTRRTLANAYAEIEDLRGIIEAWKTKADHRADQIAALQAESAELR